MAAVAPQLRADPAECLRQETFLASQLLLTLATLLAFPVYLYAWGKPDVAEVAVFALSLGPALCALHVSRTGNLERGVVLAGGAAALLVTAVVLSTGGLASPALVFMAVLPGLIMFARSRLATVAVAAAPVAAISAVAGLAATGAAEAGPAPGAALTAALAAAAMASLLGWSARRSFSGQLAQSLSRGGADAELLDHAPDLVVRLRRNGNLLAANAAARRLLGLAPEDLAGEGLVRCIHVQDRPVYLQAMDTAWLDGSATAGIRLKDGDGAFEQVELRVRRIGERRKDADLVGMLRNVQSQVESEAALRSALAAAERASIGKGRLLANMSHELRTPLNAILGFSEILATELMGKFEQERHREYAQLIHDSGSHLLDVVNAILDMSKLETGRFQVFPEPFHLDEAIKACRQLMEPQAAQGGILLEADGLGPEEEVTADPRAVKQILLNLMSNAIKFTPPGGKVMVGAYRTETGAVALYVADEGRGIAPEDIDRLGEPFVQLKTGYDHGGGTGLGLSVVRGLAQLHDGTMRIESTLGRGTRVTIVLPQADRMETVVPVRPARAATLRPPVDADLPDRLTA
ncbi:Signal transduction histidine kinase [Lutibaculum baratangense AMV1]|uniref:histidine kinase n=1 Tax=Lutibaculum baratangense AMV1 TaxID=631454 RepID=V4R990_9HYPH|nr:Signal transduction histidine kinase [Lutibaculum baratangense AMV1]